MIVSIVVAVSTNGAIGQRGRLPWRLPDDLKRFKAITNGHAVIMGRITYESIGRPLPGRQNIVISRRIDSIPAGCVGANSLDQALSLVERRDECFVIGGAQIYRDALPLANKLYLTRVHAEIDGDAHFPSFDEKEWREIAREAHPADERHAFAFEFRTLIKAPRPT